MVKWWAPGRKIRSELAGASTSARQPGDLRPGAGLRDSREFAQRQRTLVREV